MKPLRSLIDQLIERKLWPVALALLIAIVAVPVVLSKDGAGADPATPGPAAPADAEAAVARAAIVKVAGEPLPAAERKLVGKAKDPFKLGALADAEDDRAAAASDDSGSGSAATGSTGSGSSGSGPGASGSAGTVPSGTGSSPTPPAAAPEFTLYEVDVRVNRAGRTSTAVRNPARFAPLPSHEAPAAIFYGVFNNGTSAGFMLPKNAKLLSRKNGACQPSRSECGLLRVKGGRKVRYSVKGSDAVTRRYDVRVIRIVTRNTRSRAVANAWFGRLSTAGRCIVSDSASRFGQLLSIDGGNGSLRSVAPDAKACRKYDDDRAKTSASRDAGQTGVAIGE